MRIIPSRYARLADADLRYTAQFGWICIGYRVYADLQLTPVRLRSVRYRYSWYGQFTDMDIINLQIQIHTAFAKQIRIKYGNINTKSNFSKYRKFNQSDTRARAHQFVQSCASVDISSRAGSDTDQSVRRFGSVTISRFACQIFNQ